MQHLVDDQGKDACDYAKENGLAVDMPQFMNCSLRQKKADQAAAEQYRRDGSFHKRKSNMQGSRHHASKESLLERSDF